MRRPCLPVLWRYLPQIGDDTQIGLGILSGEGALKQWVSFTDPAAACSDSR